MNEYIQTKEKLYKKVVKNPFCIGTVSVYADLISAAQFHNGYIYGVLNVIREYNQSTILNEDNEIEIFLRLVGNGSTYKATYRLIEGGEISSIMIIQGEQGNMIILEDPLV